ncbi:hypothetical protein EJB05_41913, partial [Eragrostis curvula]
MGSSSGLADSWDFSHGKKFQRDVLERFRSAVHHPSSSPNGSFFLLATFRRSTFRLTEDSVGLALQSCLGGSAAGFHVKFLSDRHYRFSVASKAVGFHVYQLKQFIGSTFDVYFHLWNDGVAHWERDKRIWEEEQAREWTLVTYKKRKPSSAPRKTVSFPARLVQDSPKVKHKPNLPPPALKFGSFIVPTANFDGNGSFIFGRKNAESANLVSVSTAFSRLQRDLQMDQSFLDAVEDIPGSSPVHDQHADPNFKDSVPDCGTSISSASSVSNLICLNCLSVGHTKLQCSSPVRCKSCYNYGHVARWCLTRSRPRLMWAPKKTTVNKTQESSVSVKISSRTNYDSSPSKLASASTSRKSPPQIAAPANSTSTTMANYPVNPMLYAPAGANIEDIWQRPARGRLALGGEPPRLHEDFGIVRVNPPPAAHHLHDALDDVVAFLEDEYNVRIRSSSLSPLGLGLLQFASPTQRQSMIDLSPLPFGPHHQITVIQHDRGLNLKACNYSRECTIMFLAFPLDYQSMDFMKAAVAPFGRLLYWDSNSTNKSRVLVRVLVLSPDRVPRSLVVSQGTMLGGNGRSWTVPVYILDGQFPDIFPADEDPVPDDGNPHPLPHHAPQIIGNQQPGWMEELQGGLNEDNPFVNDMHQQNDQDEPMHDWINWQPEDVNDQPEPVPMQDHQQPAQHPEQQQDVISFNASGSTARFFRANGPDIPIDMVFQQGSSDGGASSASSASVTSSLPIPPEPPAVIRFGPALPPDMLLERMCTKAVSVAAQYVSNTIQRSLVIPSPVAKRSWDAAFKPIIVDSTVLRTSVLTTSLGETVKKNIARKLDFDTSSNNLAIVPFEPVVHSVMLQLWAQQKDIQNSLQTTNMVAGESEQNMSDNSSVSPDDLPNLTEPMMCTASDMGLDTGSETSDNASQQLQLSQPSYPPPRPHKTPRKKGLLMDAAEIDPERQLMALRRSPRIEKLNEEGRYKHVKLENTPRKRRKRQSKVQDQAGLTSSLDKMVQDIAENPEATVPIQTMQDIGEDYCQLAPEEISEDKLNKAKVSNG